MIQNSSWWVNDLDRFINGEICFEEILGYIKVGVSRISIQGAISSIFNVKHCPKEEHNLYEKLCYAEVLHCMEDYDHEELYAIYLFAKGRCFPHKLDWGGLLEKIKSESGINEIDIAYGTSMHEECQRKGGYYSDLLPTDYYED